MGLLEANEAWLTGTKREHGISRNCKRLMPVCAMREGQEVARDGPGPATLRIWTSS